MLFGRIEYIGYNVITFVLQFFTKLTFGVYYPDGSTTEEEHQLAGELVHTITRYNANKVEHISDYLTMDHTWVIH